MSSTAGGSKASHVISKATGHLKEVATGTITKKKDRKDLTDVEKATAGIHRGKDTPADYLTEAEDEETIKTDTTMSGIVAEVGQEYKGSTKADERVLYSLTFKGVITEFETEDFFKNLEMHLSFQGYDMDYIREKISTIYGADKKRYHEHLLVVCTMFYKWGNVKHARLENLAVEMKGRFTEAISKMKIPLRGTSEYPSKLTKETVTLPRVAAAHPEMVAAALIKQLILPRAVPDAEYLTSTLPEVMRFPNFMALVHPSAVTQEVYQSLMLASFSYPCALDRLVNPGKHSTYKRMWDFHNLNASSCVFPKDKPKYSQALLRSCKVISAAGHLIPEVMIVANAMRAFKDEAGKGK
jgi:hypothetical protein